jgi:hypothetical protein
MASLTYLQAVNKVLLALRETQVTDLSAPYSMLIGEFVNQAKEKVDAAWRWKALSTNVTFTTLLNQTAYPLLASAPQPATVANGGTITDESEILQDENGRWQVFDNTVASSMVRLFRRTREDEVAKNIYLLGQTPSQPAEFSYSFEDGVPLFTLVGPTQNARSMVLRMKVPQGPFSLGTEVFLTPTRSILSFATFLAMEERGEELSEKSSLYLDRHNQELQREIERDTAGEGAYDQLRNNDA